MHDLLENHPVPFFILDNNLIIKSLSNTAKAVFPEANSFMELVDLESRNKVSSFLNQKYNNQFEVNLITKSDPLALFNLYSNWDEGTLLIVCIEKTENVHHIMQLIYRLREQLEQTNFEQYSTELKRDLIPTILNVDLRDMNRLAITDVSGRLEDLPQKLEMIQELNSIIKPDLIESGKSEYMELIEKHLEEVGAIIHYIIAIAPIINEEQKK
ncbi:hypothetical protein [Bacillus alkalicellulosilyticus]|uniref:hypothetical protein n=1 Tax=Alkalihalobacterium alkalicellulosilyticum TaxID=1912214 RepID=UPI000996422A|nr:hypothetical protein [Bacillus alkalicellulosilyticus]